MNVWTKHFPFVQLEFTHALGPAPGRYPVRPGTDDDDGAELLLFGIVLGGPDRGRRRRRRALPHGAPVALTLVTHVKAELGGDEAAARQWIETCRADEAVVESWVTTCLALANRAIRAHRASCADPYFAELTRSDPRTVRVGYGPAPDVAKGEWAYAFEPKAPKLPRSSAVERSAPAEVVAAALGGKPVLLEADNLLLRALLDLDHGRLPSASLQLAAAVAMLLAELGDQPRSDALAKRTAKLPALGARLAALNADLNQIDATVEVELQLAANDVRAVTETWREQTLGRAGHRAIGGRARITG